MAIRITNKEFAEKDKEFKKACEAIVLVPECKTREEGIIPAVTLPRTIRQASKYRMKKGRAYKEVRHLL